MLIRSEKNILLEKLTKGSHEKVWFTCDSCGIGVLQRYSTYLKQKDGKFCRRCRNTNTAKRKDVKEKQSNAMKKLWTNKQYKNSLSKKLSIACKKSWTDERKDYLSKNNPMYNIKTKEKLSLSSSLSVNELKLLCKKYNYNYLGRIRKKRGGTVIIFECDKGHYQKKRLDAFRQNHYKCNKCLNINSDGENELFNFIKKFGFKIIRNDRNLIFPKEIDILIPYLKLGIEYCGIYWHSEINGNKNKNYHLNKLNYCNNKGYKLLTIFEDEWINKKDIVKSRLINILGIDNNALYARNCKVQEINTKEARIFCENYHLQGYINSRIKLGLFFNKELVSIMTFALPSIAKGLKNKQSGIYELSRFCSSIRVIGGASKLLNYFKKNYKWNEIYSYADKRWSDGNLYRKLNFKKIEDTKPNYYYIYPGKLLRYHRFNFRKDQISKKLNYFDLSKSEWENMKLNGWDRIFDCGNYKFVMLNEKRNI